MSRSERPHEDRFEPDSDTLEVALSPLDDASGLMVSDLIERNQFRLFTDRPVSPTPVDPDGHQFPVDAAVAVDALRPRQSAVDEVQPPVREHERRARHVPHGGREREGTPRGDREPERHHAHAVGGQPQPVGGGDERPEQPVGEVAVLV